jgi:hypothetical protein
MNPKLDLTLAQQRSAELQHAGEQARLSRELTSAGSRLARAPRDGQERQVTGFTLRAHHIARLDRFLGQAQRAALRAGREFAGLSIEVDGQGVVSVHATGMTSMTL